MGPPKYPHTNPHNLRWVRLYGKEEFKLILKERDYSGYLVDRYNHKDSYHWKSEAGEEVEVM